jgi:hypothetical protein
MQTKLIILIQEHLAVIKPKTDQVTGKKVKFNAETVAHDIAKFTNHLVKTHEGIDLDISENDSCNDKYPLAKKTKKAIKKILKEFAIYEIYKVMNPRKIAGETKKDNYAHNMMMGGQKRAGKYEGGKESDIKSYGKDEVRRIEHTSKSFQKSGGGFNI